MADFYIKPCKICGGDRIDYKTEIYNKDSVKTWAFCRNCGHRGLSAFGKYVNEASAREAALAMWNRS
ncbi:MAG: hypothetical protein IKW90_09175 [Lachnospiraceae bacterium]|nr:hypothetical protein [Lachnospiraceae bacterium]